MVPSAIVAPLLSPLADRGRRDRVLVLVSALRAAVTGAAAVYVGMGGPAYVVYALAVASTIVATLYRPAHSTLLPSLCRTDTSSPVPLAAAPEVLRLPAAPNVLIEAFWNDAAEAHVTSDHFKRAQAELPQYVQETPKIRNVQMEGDHWDSLGKLAVS